MEPILAKDPEAFGRDITRRFGGRLGTMTLVSTRHAYPLVAVYPRKMVALRFACVGDAAVGMHPVNAHGFNFGPLGIDALARGLRHLALRAGERFTPFKRALAASLTDTH